MPDAIAVARPSREEIADLPDYERLPLPQIHVVHSPDQAAFVEAELAQLGVAGFDTESRPVFTAQARSTGPHVVQLASLNHAFIFQAHRTATLPLLKALLESPELLKVGFGLGAERGPLQQQLGIGLQGVVDVATLFRPLGHRQSVGAKAAVAMVLGRRLQKSKRITTSNWSLPQLSTGQLHYAADDAHAALAVYLALGCPAPARHAGGPAAHPTSKETTPWAIVLPA